MEVGHFYSKPFLFILNPVQLILKDLNSLIPLDNFFGRALLKDFRHMMSQKQQTLTKIEKTKTDKVRIQSLRTNHTVMLKIVTQQLVKVHLLKMMAGTI